MSSLLSGVDQRTQLVGHNRLELLLFRLDGKQRYGINVFKVKEVISCPPLTSVPNSHHCVAGITKLRGKTFMVVDLQKAIGKPAVTDPSKCSVIITEYNRNVQGFLVPHIEHIINKHWQEVLPPPRLTGKNHFLTAVTRENDELIEILDVEKVLFDITGAWSDQEIAASSDAELTALAANYHILVADDSSVARTQIKRALQAIGVGFTLCTDGRKALTQLETWLEEGAPELKQLALVISDVEMPEMDGYTLTSEIRKNPELKHLKVLLHTSLSGVFDSALLEKVDANGFLSKFDSDELGAVIRDSVVEKMQHDKE